MAVIVQTDSFTYLDKGLTNLASLACSEVWNFVIEVFPIEEVYAFVEDAFQGLCSHLKSL